MKYESSYGKEELIRRWDEITSPARFAGANEQLDWVYNASRKGDSVRLVKKPRASYDPYATVFRGKIEATKTGSRIRGIFTKGAADYIITAFVAAIYLGVCIAYAGRAADKTVPYLLISAPVPAFSTRYNIENGLPSNTVYTLGQCRGFTQAENAILDGIPCTVDEKKRIEEYLKSGVIIKPIN